MPYSFAIFHIFFRRSFAFPQQGLFLLKSIRTKYTQKRYTGVFSNVVDNVRHMCYNVNVVNTTG